MNSEMAITIMVFLGGMLTGIVNYTGLWLTVSKAVDYRRPALLVLLSMLARIAGSLVVFHLLADGRWQRLLACLAGFFLIRLFAVNKIGKGLPSAVKQRVPYANQL